MVFGERARFAVGLAAWLLATFVGAVSAAPARAGCQLQQVAQLQVEGDHGSPMVAGKINGRDVNLLIDTGASQTMLVTDAARRLGLTLMSGPSGYAIYGAGGQSTVREAIVDLTFGGVEVRKLPMIVAGEHPIDAVSALIGWDLLSHWDVEFDLAHHAIRLLQPLGCKGDEVVYWANAYSKAAMRPNYDDQHMIGVDGLLNGRPIEAQIDSGADVSVVTVQAAEAAGIRPPSQLKTDTGVIGREPISYSTATFKSFSVGGEEIQNASIDVSDLFKAATYTTTGTMIAQRFTDLPDMLLGADFLRSHRVLIATDQKQVYFTYDGGPVFAQRAPLAARASEPHGPPAAAATGPAK